FRKKVNQDAMAFLRSFTDRRGSNPELAEKAITESKAFTEMEALDGKMIDLIVSSPDDLLRQLDGRTIKRFDGTQVPLVLKSPVRTPFALSARQKFLARIVQPDAFFVLLILGVLGLYTEFTHPGVIAPGVIGGICLILALYAMNFLPVNLAGLFLIALALAFFILEAKAPSHGILAFGGVVSMFLGALFLIRSPLTSGGVSVGVAIAGTLPFAVLAVFQRRNKSSQVQEENMEIGFVGAALIVGLLLIWFWNSIYIIKEWERGVVLRLGRLIPEAKSAGINLVFWPIETLYRINMRIETLDVPPQDIITRDNVSVKVNAVCYFRVVEA